MGIHLGCGLVIPRATHPERVARTIGAAEDTVTTVYGPAPVSLGGPCDVAVVQTRRGGRLTYADPLHGHVVRRDLPLGGQDAALRGLSRAIGDVPIGYLTAESYCDTYSIGVLQGGAWRAFVSVSGENGDAVAVDSHGKKYVFASYGRSATGATDARIDRFARELASLWRTSTRCKITTFGLIDGAMLVEWFHPMDDDADELYEVRSGAIRWRRGKPALFADGAA